jgi:hypothetical protein
MKHIRKFNEANIERETLEEAAESNLTYWKGFSGIGLPNAINSDRIKKSFIAGAKWQQERSYSEEEVLKLLKSITCDIIDEGNEQFVEEWFEQFKK